MKINESMAWRFRENLWVFMLVLVLLGGFSTKVEAFWPPDIIPHPHIPYPDSDPKVTDASK